MPASLLTLVSLGLALVCPVAACGQSGPDAPWAEVGRILQTANVSSSPYHRYNLPRGDLNVRIGDVDVAPGIALGAWVGFTGEPAMAMAMGDLVLTGGELGPVLAELSRQGIEVTAIHNHLAGETPQVLYVHFHAQGEARDIATRIDRAVRLTGTPRPVPAPRPEAPQMDTAAVFNALGVRGSASGAITKVSLILVPGEVTMGGHVVQPALGYGTPINIQKVSDDRIVATGDFSVLGSALDPLLDAMAQHGIVATALHSHLVDESPHVYYVHFWADGPTADVLRGLRAAIDAAR